MELIQFGSGPAAVSTDQLVALRSNVQIDQHVLNVIHGWTYVFRANTSAIDPPAKFEWERRANVGDPNGTPIHGGSLPPQVIGCERKIDTDQLVIANVDHDVWNSRVLRVQASNSYSEEPVWQHVVLDVNGTEIIDRNMKIDC